MKAMWHAARRFAWSVDRLNGGVGVVAMWCCLVMVLLGAFNAVARYTDRWTGWGLSSNAYIELQWYLFSVLFMLAAAVTLRDGRHVRVDLLYGRLGPRGRAWIDLLGTILFLIPFSIFALWASLPSVMSSWRVREGSPDPDGLARYPIKTLVLVAFVLLLLQGLSQLVKAIDALRHPDDSESSVGAGSEAVSHGAQARDEEAEA